MEDETLIEVTKVSEITEKHIANHIKLDDPTDQDMKSCKTFLTVAINFIKSYTGILNLDEYPDFIIVVYVLCQDMYDNRIMYIEKGNVNKVVNDILSLHSVNYL